MAAIIAPSTFPFLYALSASSKLLNVRPAPFHALWLAFFTMTVMQNKLLSEFLRATLTATVPWSVFVWFSVVMAVFVCVVSNSKIQQFKILSSVLSKKMQK